MEKLNFKELSKFTDGYDFDECAQDVAVERGQKVMYRKSNELFFDLDSEEEFQEWRKRLGVFFLDSIGVSIYWYPSASGGYHYHGIVRFLDGREISDAEAIALQSVLGSDPMREFLNMQRLFHGTKQPIRLFEFKHSIEEVEEFFAGQKESFDKCEY